MTVYGHVTISDNNLVNKNIISSGVDLLKDYLVYLGRHLSDNVLR